MKSRKNTSSSCSGGGGGSSSSGQNKMERKDVEKNRRLHMKGLCLKLSSLIPTSPRRHLQHQNHDSTSPPSSTKETVTQLDHLEQAAAYIKQLKGRIDELKKRKQQATALTTTNTKGGGMPVVEVRCQEGTLDVVVVSEAAAAAAGDGDDRAVRLHELIAVLEEEGAEVVNASFSVVGDKIFYTLHSQALCSRIGLDASRVSHRLRSLLLIS